MSPVGRIVFLLSIVTLCVHPQNLTEVFREFLPKRVFSNPDFQRQVEARLQQRANIHPDLLYHYIRFYSASLSDSMRLDTARRKHVEQELHNAERWYNLRRIEALKRQSAFIDSIGTDAAAAVRDIVNDLFDDSLSGNITVSPPHAERNFQNYLSSVYYDRSRQLPFLPDTNYVITRRNAEQQWFSRITASVFENVRSPYDGYENAIQSLFHGWHLFEPGQETVHALSPAVSAVNLYESVFASSAQPEFGIGTGYTPVQTGFSAETTIPINNTAVRQPIDQSFQSGIFSITFRKRFFLSDFLSRFSFISFTAGYSASGRADAVSPKLGFDKIYTTNERTYGTEYHESLQFFTLTIKPEELNYADVTLTTPVIVAVPWTIELGLRYAYLKTRYTLTYHYHYYLTEKYLVDGQFIQYYVTNTITTSTDKRTENLTHINHQFLPVADISFHFSRDLFLRTVLNHRFGSISLWMNID